VHHAGWGALIILVALAGQFVPNIQPPGPPPPQPWPALVLRVEAIGPFPSGYVKVVPADDPAGAEMCDVGPTSTVCIFTTFRCGSTLELRASADAAFMGAEEVQGHTAVIRLYGPRIVDVLLLPTTWRLVAGIGAAPG
jgi:hypothetical protein